ncbi:MAG TPA: hypothetical protein VFQ90_11830 [Stellaceae bacterium]|jgi:hypothetical protein|nr:hypothetical protein [Stellaceae bacterium]
MVDPVSATIAVLSLAVSGATAWLTLFRRGTVKMTQPTVIFFGPDMPRSHDGGALPKIYLRSLFFSTSKRGRVIESMHISLARNETHQNFNIWVYGARDKLVRGSGLFVGETGVSANHHFLVPEDGRLFRFSDGHYRLDVFAKLLGDSHPIKLFSQTLDISRDHAKALEEKSAGIYFDWGPDSARYLPHVERLAPSRDAEGLLRFLEETAAEN